MIHSIVNVIALLIISALMGYVLTYLCDNHDDKDIFVTNWGMISTACFFEIVLMGAALDADSMAATIVWLTILGWVMYNKFKVIAYSNEQK